MAKRDFNCNIKELNSLLNPIQSRFSIFSHDSCIENLKNRSKLQLKLLNNFSHKISLKNVHRTLKNLKYRFRKRIWDCCWNLGDFFHQQSQIFLHPTLINPTKISLKRIIYHFYYFLFIIFNFIKVGKIFMCDTMRSKKTRTKKHFFCSI